MGNYLGRDLKYGIQLSPHSPYSETAQWPAPASPICVEISEKKKKNQHSSNDLRRKKYTYLFTRIISSGYR